MIKLSNKIISSIVGIALAGGVITAMAATAQPKNEITSAAQTSSIASSAAMSSTSSVSSSTVVSSEGNVSKVETITQEASSSADTASKIVSKKAPDIKYAVIDLNNGCRPVFPSEANYQKCKESLAAYGNDAGTCSPENSKACQAAIAAYKAKQAAASTQAPTK